MTRILRPVVAPPTPKWHNPTARVSSVVPPWSRGYTRSYYRGEPLHVPPPHTHARQSPARVLSPKERPQSAGPALRRPTARPTAEPDAKRAHASQPIKNEPAARESGSRLVAPWDKESGPPRSLSRGRARPTSHVAYNRRIPFALSHRAASWAGRASTGGRDGGERVVTAGPATSGQSGPGVSPSSMAPPTRGPGCSPDRVGSAAIGKLGGPKGPAPRHDAGKLTGAPTADEVQRAQQRDALRHSFLRVVFQRERENALHRAEARSAAEEQTTQRLRAQRAPEIRPVSNFLRSRCVGRGPSGRRRRLTLRPTHRATRGRGRGSRYPFTSAGPRRARPSAPTSLREWAPALPANSAGGGGVGVPEHRRSTPLRPDVPRGRPAHNRLPSYLTITPASERRGANGKRVPGRGDAGADQAPSTPEGHYRSADMEIRRIAEALCKGASTPLAGGQ